MVKRLSNTNQNSQKLINLQDPVDPYDAVTKKYVDDNAGGSYTFSNGLTESGGDVHWGGEVDDPYSYKITNETYDSDADMYITRELGVSGTSIHNTESASSPEMGSGFLTAVGSMSSSSWSQDSDGMYNRAEYMLNSNGNIYLQTSQTEQTGADTNSLNVTINPSGGFVIDSETSDLVNFPSGKLPISVGSGQVKDMANPTDNQDATTKSYVDAALNNKATKLNVDQFRVPYRSIAGNGEPNTGTQVSSTSTASTLVFRDVNGRAKIQNGVDSDNIVNKGYVDNAVRGFIANTPYTNTNYFELLKTGTITASSWGIAVVDVFNNIGIATSQSVQVARMKITWATNAGGTITGVRGVKMFGDEITSGLITLVGNADGSISIWGRSPTSVYRTVGITQAPTIANNSGALIGFSSPMTSSATAPTGVVTSTLTGSNVNVQTSASTLTPDVSLFDQYDITALAANLTINLPDNPVNGSKIVFRIKDNGTARTLTWAVVYNSVGVTLPTTTVANKWLYVGAIYNSIAAKWDVIAVSQQA